MSKGYVMLFDVIPIIAQSALGKQELPVRIWVGDNGTQVNEVGETSC